MPAPPSSRRCGDPCRRSARRSDRPSSTVIDPALTCAESIQYDGFVRRQYSYQAIKSLASQGVSIKTITRQTARSRKLVRSVLRGGDGDVFRGRNSTLGPHLAKLGADWDAGCHNGAELWRRLRRRIQGRLANCDGKGDQAVPWRECRAHAELHVPPAREISRMTTTDGERLLKADAVTVAAIETGVPALAPWLVGAGGSLLASFCKGISGLAAVKAALTEAWSNRQTKGQITKLKLVKCQI